MKSGKHYFWIIANIYGFIFGWPLLRNFHRAALTLSLHALGYDNTYKPFLSGEEHFIRTVLAKSDVQICIDVGANIGNYTATLLRYLPATVYAIEPVQASFSLLKERFESCNVIPVHTAFADSEGTRKIFRKSATAETATLDERVLTADAEEETVTVTTLDRFVRQFVLTRIDFLKIDTEGFEREVLRGGQETLRNLRPSFVQFEFNILHLRREYTLLEITRLLPGYHFYRLVPHGWIPIDPERFADNVFMYSNVVAVRNDIRI